MLLCSAMETEFATSGSLGWAASVFAPCRSGRVFAHPTTCPGNAGATDGAGGSRTKFGAFRFHEKKVDKNTVTCSGVAKGTKLTKITASTTVKVLVWNSDICGPNTALGPTEVSRIPDC